MVCDGFTGNITLKASEGVASTIFSLMKTQITKINSSKNWSFIDEEEGFATLKNKVDYAEYGGAPLLGINGCAIISHGKVC